MEALEGQQKDLEEKGKFGFSRQRENSIRFGIEFEETRVSSSFFPPLFQRETQSNKSSSPLIPAGAAPHSDKSIPRLKIGRSRWSRAANPKWLISFQLGLVLALSLVLRIVPLLPSRTTRAFRYANVTFEYVRF